MSQQRRIAAAVIAIPVSLLLVLLIIWMTAALASPRDKMADLRMLKRIERCEWRIIADG